MTAALPIGGFFGLEPAGEPLCAGSVLERWTQGSGWLGFHNARSAVAHMIRSLAPGTVWLPRYLCADMDAAAGTSVRGYGVDLALELDDPAFETALSPGDLVVAVAYFGAQVCPRLRGIAAQRTDVTWLEDRAQALDPGEGVPGAWRLYSPRKLLGVADGGLLVGPVSTLPVPELAPAPVGHDRAARARAAASTRDEVADAYRLYVEVERSHTVADFALSEATRDSLAASAVDGLAARRRANVSTLDARLAAHAAPLAGRLRDARAPFGYPLSLAGRRDAVAAALAAEGLFCAVHWRDLGQAAAGDPVASTLRAGMLTLPVDHRYGPAEMERLAEGVRRALA